MQSTTRLWLCVMNMMLHGSTSKTGQDGKDQLPVPVTDAFAADPDDRFEIILTNPTSDKKAALLSSPKTAKTAKKKTLLNEMTFVLPPRINSSTLFSTLKPCSNKMDATKSWFRMTFYLKAVQRKRFAVSYWKFVMCILCSDYRRVYTAHGQVCGKWKPECPCMIWLSTLFKIRNCDRAKYILCSGR